MVGNDAHDVRLRGKDDVSIYEGATTFCEQNWRAIGISSDAELHDSCIAPVINTLLNNLKPAPTESPTAQDSSHKSLQQEPVPQEETVTKTPEPESKQPPTETAETPVETLQLTVEGDDSANQLEVIHACI